MNSSNEFKITFLETLDHPTPFFLFSRKQILENLHKFQKCFPGSSIHYAIKANSEQEVLTILAHADCGFEVASIYELEFLKKIKISPEKIIYGTSVKPASYVKAFFNYGVDRFAFDSLPELEKIASMAPGSKVYVRTIVNDAGSVFKFSEKFGTPLDNVVPLLIRAKELKLHPYGISFHVGSQASNPTAWGHALENLNSPLRELKSLGIELDVLNLGGGYPCKYASNIEIPTLNEIAEFTLKHYKRLLYQPNLILEPGRGIIADTGILIVSVIARVERRGSTWLFLDAGCYNGLFEAMAYQGSTRYAVTSMRPAGDSGESLFALAGPTGDSPDVITREALLPRDIEVGDKLVFHNVGAYTLSVISQFNGFPKPSVYFI